MTEEPQVREGRHTPKTPWQEATPLEKAVWVQKVICPVLNALMAEDCLFAGVNIEYQQDSVVGEGAGPVTTAPNGVVNCTITFYMEGLDGRRHGGQR